MFDCAPNISLSYYYMKSDKRLRYLQIQSGQEYFYRPLVWLVNIIDTKY